MAITTRTIEANGLTFVVDVAGSGYDIALCLHGFPESRLCWRHQLEPLGALGWHVVAPDLRGYGESSRPVGVENYRMQVLVEDVAALFDALGAKRRLLVGHDWGAAIAWAFALRALRPLDGLVVMNVPHPAIFSAVLRRSWAQKGRSWYMSFFQLPLLPELALTFNHAGIVGWMFTGTVANKGVFSPEVIRQYRDNAVRPGAMTAMLSYYRANVADFSLAAKPMAKLETPTLMIWGEADVALGLELTEGYGPHVADFTLERLPGVSHWVQQEAPGPVNQKLTRWLRARNLAPGRTEGAPPA